MPQPGDILRNHYKIVKILGSGGFGDTYLAQDIDLPGQPKCVVKHLKPNPDPKVLEIVRRLFDSEAQVLYRLGNDSDQIPRLFAHFEEQGEFYLVQEFIDGQDLSYEIIPSEKLTEIAVIKLLQEILKDRFSRRYCFRVRTKETGFLVRKTDIVAVNLKETRFLTFARVSSREENQYCRGEPKRNPVSDFARCSGKPKRNPVSHR